MVHSSILDHYSSRFVDIWMDGHLNSRPLGGGYITIGKGRGEEVAGLWEFGWMTRLILIYLFQRLLLIYMLVRGTNERFLPTRVTFRASSASESHWLQPVLVLVVHWWPAPICVGGLKGIAPTIPCSQWPVRPSIPDQYLGRFKGIWMDDNFGSHPLCGGYITIAKGRGEEVAGLRECGWMRSSILINFGGGYITIGKGQGRGSWNRDALGKSKAFFGLNCTRLAGGSKGVTIILSGSVHKSIALIITMAVAFGPMLIWCQAYGDLALRSRSLMKP